MTTRGGKIKQIADVAQGRVFIAEQAKDLGMVDEIGGVETAIAYAADQAKLSAAAYEVRVVPAPRTLMDLISGSASSEELPIKPRSELTELSVLKAMPAEVRSMVSEQLEIQQLLQKHPVVLTAPFVVREK
jgi:protease-4